MNWAEEYAQVKETKSEWRQFNRKERAQERAIKKALAEKDILFNQWKKWHDDQLGQFLEGDYSAAAIGLHKFLGSADLQSADQLIELVQQGPWQQADEETRYLVLRMINHRIVFMRESNGLAPFDDPLPDESPSAFILIREMLSVRDPTPSGS